MCSVNSCKTRVEVTGMLLFVWYGIWYLTRAKVSCYLLQPLSISKSIVTPIGEAVLCPNALSLDILFNLANPLSLVELRSRIRLYRAMANATSEVVWLHNLMITLGFFCSSCHTPLWQLGCLTYHRQLRLSWTYQAYRGGLSFCSRKTRFQYYCHLLYSYHGATCWYFYQGTWSMAILLPPWQVGCCTSTHSNLRGSIGHIILWKYIVTLVVSF